MNLLGANIVIRPRSGFETLDLAFRVVRSLAPRQILLLLGWVTLPLFGLSLGLWYWSASPWLTWLFAVPLVQLLQLPFLLLFGELQFDKGATARAALRSSKAVFSSFFAGLFLYWLVMAAGSLIVIGFFIFGGRYFYLPEILVLERAAPKAAFKRAARFVSPGQSNAMQLMLGHLLLRLSFIGFTEIIGQACLEYVLSVHRLVPSLFEVGCSPFALLGLFLSVPYCSAFSFFGYTNERTVQDGWDIQVAFLGLANAPTLISRRTS